MGKAGVFCFVDKCKVIQNLTIIFCHVAGAVAGECSILYNMLFCTLLSCTSWKTISLCLLSKLVCQVSKWTKCTGRSRGTWILGYPLDLWTHPWSLQCPFSAKIVPPECFLFGTELMTSTRRLKPRSIGVIQGRLKGLGSSGTKLLLLISLLLSCLCWRIYVQESSLLSENIASAEVHGVRS